MFSGFRLIPTGWGDFYLIPYDATDGLAALGGLGVFALIMIITLSLIKVVLLIPFVFLVLILCVIFSFGVSNTLSPLAAIAFPLFVYGFESFLWGMMGDTSRGKIGLMALLIWVILGGALLILGLVLCTSVHIVVGMLSLAYFAYMWFIPFMYSGSDKDPVAFKHLFTITNIILLAGILTLYVFKYKDKRNEKNIVPRIWKGFVADLLSFGLGFAPLIVASIFAKANQYVALIFILASYAGCGIVLKIVTEKLKGSYKDIHPAFGPIMLPVTYMLLFSIRTEINAECLVPYGFLPSFTEMFNTGLTVSGSAGISNAVSALNNIICGIFYLIISLIGNLFDADVKFFNMPSLVAFVLVFALIAFLVGTTSGVLKFQKKS